VRPLEIKALLLAAGVGSRLAPLTKEWPKCLMPIGKRPLLEYWIEIIYLLNIEKVLVNLHHHSLIVKQFLKRDRFSEWVNYVSEKKLLGTAGTLRENKTFLANSTILLVHADNWCQCDFKSFVKYHIYKRPDNCPITMMTFETDTPESCGIVELDKDNILTGFHEKVKNPPGNIANSAIYLIEPEIMTWLDQHPNCSDFSTEVLPEFIGRIATWHNSGIHRDIGVLPSLQKAQLDPKPSPVWSDEDNWQKLFLTNVIHNAI